MVKKHITKTPEQAKLEKQRMIEESTCPSCGYNACMGLEGREEIITGWFSKETIKFKEYSCVKCGCEWKIYID